MTQKETTRKLLNLLATELEPFNFRMNLKEQGFIRKDEQAIYFYYFLVYSMTNIKTGKKGFQIEPYADINIPQIESYYKKITVNNELKSDWHFITAGNSIANLRANPDGVNRKMNQSLDLFVFEEEHLRPLAIEIIKQFKQVALPYFLANNTVRKIDELLNKHPEEYNVNMVNDLFRFIKGLIAAKINNNPKFNELLSTYSHLIIDWNMPEDCIEEMERLKRLLPEIETR